MVMSKVFRTFQTAPARVFPRTSTHSSLCLFVLFAMSNTRSPSAAAEPIIEDSPPSLPHDLELELAQAIMHVFEEATARAGPITTCACFSATECLLNR